MESQKSISDWAVATFGPHGTNESVVARANQEMAELLKAVAVRDWQAAKTEAADCAIVLMRLATRLGVNVDCFLANVQTSGDVSSMIDRAAVCANLSMAKAIHHVGAAEGADAQRAIADCVFWLRALCACLGSTLGAQVDAKMAINRTRKWDLDGHGHGYHVRAPEKADTTKILPRVSEALERLGFASKRPALYHSGGIGGLPLSSLEARNLIDELGRLGIAFVEAPLE